MKFKKTRKEDDQQKNKQELIKLEDESLESEKNYSEEGDEADCDFDGDWDRYGYGDYAETVRDSLKRVSKFGIIFIFFAAILMLSYAVGVIVFETVEPYIPLTYFGGFIACLYIHSTVLLTYPCFPVVLQYAHSANLNPILVAVCAATGAAVGEMIGYVVGRLSTRIISQESIKEELESKIPPYPYVLLVVLSVLPSGFYDILGIIAGMVGLEKKKFFAASFLGKTLKFLCLILAARIFPEYYMRYI